MGDAEVKAVIAQHAARKEEQQKKLEKKMEALQKKKELNRPKRPSILAPTPLQQQQQQWEQQQQWGEPEAEGDDDAYAWEQDEYNACDEFDGAAADLQGAQPDLHLLPQALQAPYLQQEQQQQEQEKQRLEQMKQLACPDPVASKGVAGASLID